MGNASGFFCRYKGKIFLITNLHVVTGKKIKTQEIVHEQLAMPGSMIIHGRYAKNDNSSGASEGENLFYSMGGFRISQELAIEGRNVWLEHPIYGQNVDVVAIQLDGELFQDNITHAFDIEKETTTTGRIQVAGTVFIVGYPLSRASTNNPYPIYKSGTIASEPDIHDAEPRFYVDSKTKRGMSGSAVIYQKGIEVNNGGGSQLFTYGEMSLIGIYSGRDGLAPTEYEAELGRVWPLKDCILPILDQLA